MTDRELDARIAIQASVNEKMPAAQRLINKTVIPRMTDTRHSLALDIAVQEIKDALAHGHTDVDRELLLALAVLQSWSEELEAERVQAPVSEADFGWLP